MRKLLWLFPAFFLLVGNALAEVAPAKVIGATTVDTMFAKNLLDKGGIIFVDVRKPEDYQKGHIPSAINLSLADFTEEALSTIAKKDSRVVFYCTGVPCLASSKATKMALDWGWSAVFYYRTGFLSWQRSGLEVEK